MDDVRCRLPTVLCIDDYSLGLATTISILRANSYRVLAVADVERVIDLFVENPVDAVILDCHLLQGRTRQVVEALRTLRPSIPIIMMSACCSLPCAELRNADFCIQKGKTGRSLLRVLETAIVASRYGLCRSLAA